MCKNHNLRHIDPEVVAFCEEVIRLQDRGSEENVEHILQETLSTLVWAGLSAYLFDVIQYRDAELCLKGERLCRRAFDRNFRAMDAWAAAHPEAHVSTVTVESTIIAVRREE